MPNSRRTSRLLVAVVLAGTPAAASLIGTANTATAAGPNPACPDAASSTLSQCRYLFTGDEQTYTVPAGVSSVRITAVGAPGNASSTAAGGRGAVVTATVGVSAGATLYVEVGGTGAAEPTANFNGGGPGGSEGGGGGGASDVRTCSAGQCTAFYPEHTSDCLATAAQLGAPSTACTPDPRLVVAGGGGGAGTNATGGSGGDPTVTGPGDGGAVNDGSPARGGGNGGFGGALPAYYGAPTFLGWGGSLCQIPTMERSGNKLVAVRIGGCQLVVGRFGSGGGGGGYQGGGAGAGFVPSYPKDGGGAGSSYWIPTATDTAMSTDTTGTASVTITALDAPQSVSFTTTPPVSAVVGDSYAVSAAATSNLPVTLSVDPSSTPDACTLSGSTLSFDHVGTCVVDADQPGDAEWAPAPQARQSIEIGPATPTLAWPAPADTPYGTALDATELDATASVPGTFAYLPPAGTVLDVGTHVLGVTFTPTDGSDYTGASGAASITVTPAPTSITLTVSPARPVRGAQVRLDVLVTHGPLAAGALEPGGTVVFLVDGARVGAPAEVADGQARSEPITGLTPGEHTVSAQYSGDARYRGSTASASVAVREPGQLPTPPPARRRPPPVAPADTGADLGSPLAVALLLIAFGTFLVFAATRRLSR